MKDKKGLEITVLAQKDLSIFKSMLNLFNIVFEEEERIVGSDTHLLKLLSNNQFIAIAAISDSEVVGGVTAYKLPMAYSDRSEIFLYDMAVKSEFQRMGIGKRLIESLKEYCIKNKIEIFFVMAHEEDGHAIEFYHATGGKSEKVVNFLYEVFEEKE